jgi:hypothetical protein
MNLTADPPDEEFFESLMAGYADAWNREDIDAIESYYHLPFFSYKDGALEVFSDADLSRAAELQWIEVNRREGPARWERLNSEMQRLGRSAVLVTTHWAFRRPDGTSVWDFVDTFQLCRFEGRWLFLNRTLHD